MARLNPPRSKAIVDVSDDLVAQYVAQGWSEVKDAKPVKEQETASETGRRRPRGSNK